MPGELTAVLSALCYSLSYVLLRKGQTTSDPPDHGLFPILFTSAMTLFGASLWSHLLHSHHTVWLTQNTIRSACIFAILAGLIGTLLGRLALYSAISKMGATRGIIVKSLAPLVTFAIAAFILHEGIDEEHLYGIGLFLLSIFLLFCERKFDKTRAFSFQLFQQSLFIALMAALFQGLGHTLRKLAVSYYLLPITAATIDILTAFIVYVMILIIRKKLISLIRFYWKNFNLLLIVAGMLSASGVLLFFEAVATTPVTTVSMIIGIEPVMVSLLTIFILPNQERVTMWAFTAAIAATCGVLIISL